jgi:DNA-directed RNA polymerase specialized sigma24 family protein
MTSDPDDAELIARSLDGDDDAFVEVVRRHEAAVGALGLLGPQQREILTLVAWEDLTVADAGRVLGMPPGTARRRLHEARMMLRNAPGMAALLTDQNTIKETS